MNRHPVQYVFDRPIISLPVVQLSECILSIPHVEPSYQGLRSHRRLQATKNSRLMDWKYEF